MVHCVLVSPFHPGDVLDGRFELKRELGRGGMGTVWAATHVVTKRDFALKLLNERRADDPTAKERLRREARAACLATHPAILPVDDVVELDQGGYALVMELLEGESLRACLDREGRLPWATVRETFEPVLSGLAAAHEAGIVHRDLKPDNIFLVSSDPSRPVRILDFGIAQSTMDEAPLLTSTGAMLGTPYYMAPEQAFGEGTKGPPSDIWSLGVVLFECLAGARPTQAANLGQVLRLMSEERIPKLTDASVDGVPMHIAHIIDRMLSRAHDARPSLSEIQAAWRAPSEGAESPLTARSQRRRARWVTPVGIVILLGAGGVAWTMRAGTDSKVNAGTGAGSGLASGVGAGPGTTMGSGLGASPPAPPSTVATTLLAARSTASGPPRAPSAGSSTVSRLPSSSATPASAPTRSVPGIVEQPPY